MKLARNLTFLTTPKINPMKNITKLLVILVPLFWISGCSQDPGLVETNLSIDQILGDKKVIVYKGMLAFKDNATFDQIESDLADKDRDFILAWEKNMGFKSLYSVYEDVVEEEARFLDQMVKKYGDGAEVTRTEMGYSSLTEKYLGNGALRITHDELLDMDITVPSLAPLVNSEGFVRVGNEIRQYKSTFVKVILDGDYNSIARLPEVKESTANVHVGSVERTRTRVSDASRTQALSSCSHTAGSHRIIGYEEHVVSNEGGSPCPVYRNDYYIRARSLKRILGTWQNFRTNQFRFRGEVTLDHVNCDLSFNRNVHYAAYSSGGYSGEYHTYDYRLVLRYDTGPCVSSASTCSGPGYVVFRSGATRTHTVSGVNGTTCTMP